MADERPPDPAEDLVFRRGKLRKRDDPAIDLAGLTNECGQLIAFAFGDAAHGIHYRAFPDLGGRRKPSADSPHTVWRNPSFRAYAAFTWTEEFANGLAQLLDLASGLRTAMMCSEVLWWRCHRALISDVLCVLGHEVRHIAGLGRTTLHPYTSPARLVDGELAYPSDGGTPLQHRLDRPSKAGACCQPVL